MARRIQWPSRFPVGLTNVKIRMAEVDDFDQGDQGAYRQDRKGQKEISMSPLLEGTSQDIVIGHEIIHSWLDTSGLANMLTSEQEETVCDALAPLLVQLLGQAQKEVE